ncbi:MAG TPA: glutathione peroxidase [Flavobacteriales bacterium]|nr:glutathione peroxidase [Flavobacteriales bacterium]
MSELCTMFNCNLAVATVLMLGCLSACTAPEANGQSAVDAQTQPAMGFHQLNATDINGHPFDLTRLKGHKVLVVNTASECGFTPQYKGLEELYERYKGTGFMVVGFPSNDFGGQEPGDEKQIAAFCTKNYGVTFPMMAKVHTKGPDQSPVYAWLTRKKLNGVLDSEVKWNFQKYLIDQQGRLVAMYPSAQEPLSEAIINWVEGK